MLDILILKHAIYQVRRVFHGYAFAGIVLVFIKTRFARQIPISLIRVKISLQAGTVRANSRQAWVEKATRLNQDHARKKKKHSKNQIEQIVRRLLMITSL